MASYYIIAACTVATVSAAAYSIDSSRPGPRFDGIGAISGGGATSRLLFGPGGYPKEQLSDILDFLFLPNFGASFHILKVEIGGDGQSSEGSESSHMHNATDLNFGRGYEWDLMVEARKRNPAILIGALAWAWPGWVGGGTSSPWTNPALSVTYIVNWLKGARDVYNVTLDFIDSDWNERGWSPVFVKALRTGMDAAGFASTKIVCGDDAHTFTCASSINSDPELASIVYAIGSHNPGPDPIAERTGKPMWGSELEVSDDGGTDTASHLSSLFINQNITGFVFWNLLTSYYEGLFAFDQGNFRAYQPWSGWYELSGRTWAVAHVTQTTAPGWRYLAPNVGSGNLQGGGTYVTWVNTSSNDITLLVNKPAGSSPETAVFTLAGPVASISSLNVWHSTLVSGNDPHPDLSGYFNALAAVTVSGGQFSVQLSPGDLFTFTTTTVAQKGSRPASPHPAPFPTSYSDDFDNCPVNQEAAYWTDQTGVWECVASGGSRGVVMQQVVPMHPVAWRPDEQRPCSVLGDIDWVDSDMSVDVMMPGATDTALVGARANPNCCSRVITGEDMLPGVWLALTASTSTFYVYNAIANVSKTSTALLTGTLPNAPAAGTWYTVRLVVQANVAAAFVNGASIFTGLDVGGRVPTTGFAGIGTGTWGQFVSFDKFSVTANETQT